LLDFLVANHHCLPDANDFKLISDYDTIILPFAASSYLEFPLGLVLSHVVDMDPNVPDRETSHVPCWVCEWSDPKQKQTTATMFLMFDLTYGVSCA
jgi:hypothetical protein